MGNRKLCLQLVTPCIVCCVKAKSLSLLCDSIYISFGVRAKSLLPVLHCAWAEQNRVSMRLQTYMQSLRWSAC